METKPATPATPAKTLVCLTHLIRKAAIDNYADDDTFYDEFTVMCRNNIVARCASWKHVRQVFREYAARGLAAETDVFGRTDE